MVKDWISAGGHCNCPLILTIWIEEPAQQYFNEMRRSYFPAERNYLAAHLTLFHALPDEKFIYDETKLLCQTGKIFSVNAESVVSIGNGTAIKTVSPVLNSIHQRCQALWWHKLTPQDKQKLWPHVTVQNKVDAGKAKDLKKQLNESFEPFTFHAVGLQLWRYLGGPWEPVDQFKFPEK